MNILLAFDSFKESMSSLEAAQSFTQGFQKIHPDAKLTTTLLSDGGEGFVEAFIYNRGEILPHTVTGPLNTTVSASYGLIKENKTAVIEMASASGLELLSPEQRNPLKTTTFGTGELIKAACSQRIEQMFIGIGGSATVDGGAGMAQALGAKFFDKSGKRFEHPLTGGDLINIDRIVLDQLDPAIKSIQFTVACDVDNPLLGPKGAAAVFGPQKGADSAMVFQLEEGLANLANVITRDLHTNITDLPGAGAAGGLGGMLHALLKASMKSGIDIVMEAIGLEEQIRPMDLVITGEGRVDSQTVDGKTISGIVRVAKAHHVPVLVVGGSIAENDMELLDKGGIDATISLVSSPMSLEEAIKSGSLLMTRTGERVARLMRCFN